MPFSTYLNEPSSNQSRLEQDNTRSSQQGYYPPYPGYGVYSGGLDTTRQSGSYDYSPSAPSPPLNVHSSNGKGNYAPVPSSSTSSTGQSTGDHNGNKSYVLSSPTALMQQRPGGSDGIFQMPAFLMGNFGGTLAPGGGAEVLPPGALGIFDFASSEAYAPPLPSSSGGSDGGKPKPSWQTIKYYTLAREDVEETTSPPQTTATTATETATRGHAPATGAPAAAGSSSTSTSNSNSDLSTSEPAPADAPAASPFGYLNAESPRQQQQVRQHNNASNAQAQEEEEAEAEEASQYPTNSDADESSPAMENERGSEVFRQSQAQLYAPIPVPAHSHALVPSAGLPVYSQSGFDMLSILARVARRPNPTISLGPVDLTCAFVVADVRRVDAPVVYASRTFYELTGYSESEVLGRNCRFLQAPGGRVVRGESRRFTSPDAVRELRFALDKDREVQVSLINYRKDGRPFVNRVSIVPIPAEDGASEIAFHVGFQVDLNEQPGLIAQRIRDGKFYSGGGSYADGGGGGYKGAQAPVERSARAMGKRLREVLSDRSFQSAVQLTTSCNSGPPFVGTTSALNANADSPSTKPAAVSNGKPDARDERQWLQLLLLEYMPDFVHVLSLKGHFLYVSPGITRVLGYAPRDLLGRSVGDFCHPSDAVPLLRELKESTGQSTNTVVSESSGGGEAQGGQVEVQTQSQSQSQAHGQRIVDLLFRMRTKAGGYTWIESIGRLHVEAGKGRKAIVLSGRMCAMPDLRWGAILQAGGLVGPVPSSLSEETDSDEVMRSQSGGVEREFWAMLCEDGLFLVASTGVRDLLGWGTAEMIGRSVREFVVDDGSAQSSSHACSSSEQVLSALGRAYSGESGTQCLTCRMKRRDGEVVWMQVMVYANESRTDCGRVIVQFRFLAPTSVPESTSAYQAYSPTAYVNPASASGTGSGSAYAFAFAPSHPHTSSYPYNNSAVTLSSQTGIPRGAGRVTHAPSTNVFAEFETHRGTSWQYELQQLKYANDKLREEVGVLEVRVRRSRVRHQQQQQQQQIQQRQIQQQQSSSLWVQT